MYFGSLDLFLFQARIGDEIFVMHAFYVQKNINEY